MKTNDKIEVKKIDIKIGDNTISLKPEQAKELKKILNEMFEESNPVKEYRTVVHEHHYPHYYWNWPYQWTYTIGGTSYCSSTLTNCGSYSNTLSGTSWGCSSTDTGNVTLCLNAA